MIIGILVSWIAIGLLVSLIAGKFVDLGGDDPRLGYGVAGAAAMVLGGVYSFVSGAGVESWNVWSMLFAAIGAFVGVVVWHLVRSRFISREPYTRRQSY
jgi:uncharacterized membrane protein YeaQ/YmgE (transglycosylase-associated protein family)